MLHDSEAAAEAAAGDFLAMYDQDRADGQQRARADYLARFPGFEARIAREFDALANGHDRAPKAPAANGAAGPDGPARTIGHYRLLHELGRGGQGVVWLAQDLALDRRIALKVLDERGGWLSSTRRERLQREATALARLDHPAICPIHEADLTGSTPFLAMRYVAGESLAARLQRARQSPDAGSNRLLAALPDRPARIAATLALIERVARALHAAHEQGVVHRDVKPQNVMLTADDQPVVLDFGVARFEDGDGLTRTRSGELFGSLAYLPPERLVDDAAADRRGDVYALGVVLHECLTLQRPFAAPTTAALIAEIAAGQRLDPRQLNRAIPRDLQLVLATALDTDPHRRYATALEFAEDLRRLQHHEPIAARPIGGWLRLRRWTRRHPVVAATTSMMLVALVAATVLLLQLIAQRRGLLAWQQVLEAVSAGDQGVEALGRVLAAAAFVPPSKLDGPLIELLTRDSTRLSLTPERLGSEPVSAPFFGSDDRTLCVPTAAGDLLTIDVDSGDIRARSHLHDGAQMFAQLGPRGCLLTSGLDDRVRCFDTTPWHEIALPPAIAHSNDDVRRIADPSNHLPRLPKWSPTGEHFVLLGFDGSVIGSAVDAAAKPWRIDQPGWWAKQARFSPDGERLAVRWQVGRQQGAAHVYIYATADGRELHRLELDGQESMCCDWSPDGAWFAVGGHDGVVRVFDTRDWRCRTRLETRGEDLAHVYWLGFHPAGTQLVTLGFEGLIVWRLADGERMTHFAAANARPFHIAAWNADGSRLAAVVKDGSIRVYDTATWTQFASSRWHHRYPNDLLWNHAGDRLVFQDGRGLQLAALQAPAPEFRPHSASIVSIEFAAAGATVLTASRDATAAIIDLDTGSAMRRWTHPAPLCRARWSPDRQRVATACEDGVVRVFDARAGGLLLNLPAHTGAAIDAWFCAGGRRVLGIGADGRVQLVDANSGAAVGELASHERSCLCATVDDELGLFATGGADHRVLVHDVDGKLVATLSTLEPGASGGLDIEGNASAVAFDAARRRLVVANRRDALLVFDVDSWQPTWVKARTQGQQYSMHLAALSGGAHYATAHSGVGDWTFIDAATLTPHDVGRAGFPTAIVSALHFSPDTRLLLVASRDDSVSLWDLQCLERRLELRGTHGGLRAAAWSRDGTWVATGSQDGTLRAWPVQPLPFAERHYARMVGTGPGR